MDAPIEKPKHIPRRKGKPSGAFRRKPQSGITESQFDEALRRVIRKPAEKPDESKESET
jgi:hypothetical protein